MEPGRTGAGVRLRRFPCRRLHAAGSPTCFRGRRDVPVIRSWAEVMEQSPDYLPIIDIPDRPGNYVVVTASAHGFGITPATGKVVSDLVLHRDPPATIKLRITNYELRITNYELRIFPIAHDGFGN